MIAASTSTAALSTVRDSSNCTVSWATPSALEEVSLAEFYNPDGVAGRPRLIRLLPSRRPGGTCVQAVVLRAVMNPERTFLAVSDPMTKRP